MKSLTSSFPHRSRICPIIFAFTLIFSLINIALPSTAQAEGYYPTQGGTYHVVKRGDTLRNIAIAYGTTTYALAHANGLHDINRIEVGQHIYIPNGYIPSGRTPGHGGYQKPQVAHPPKPRHPQPASSHCAAYHLVRKGESLSVIAQWYHVDAHALAHANQIYDLNHVYTGQNLCIPAGKQVQKPVVQIPVVQKPVVQKQQHYKPQHYKPAPPPVYHAPTPVPPTPAPVPHQPIQHHYGWTGSYFAHTQCGGAPLYTRHDAEINFDWGHGGPGGGLWHDNFSVAWTTDAHFYAGDYRFHAQVDDGIRVYVDNYLVIDGWREQSATNYAGDIWLSEGYHHVRVEYFEQGGVASVKVHWRRL